MQARKSILYHNESCWGKKTGELFDVGMGSNDGAEVSEVVGLYILDLISKNIEIDRDLFGLYRDDGIMIVDNANGPKIDRIRKKLHQIFNSIGLKIATLINTDTANYLDITLDLRDMSYKPYHKPNEKLQYINIKSNYPPSIIKNLPKMIETRLSRISSDKKKFDESKDRYEEALRASGYKYKLEYSSKAKEQKKSKRIRKRKIIWYNPPYNKNVKTNIGSAFLSLLDKHFNHSHILHKIFNRNTIKISYSCTSNVGQMIKANNKIVLDEPNRNTLPRKSTNCNCRKKSTCPLKGECQSSAIVYNAKLKVNNNTYNYIGHTEHDFKTRYNNHKTSFNNHHHRNATALSKKIWELKEKKVTYAIEWEILERSRAYHGGARQCNLCIAEKYHIITSHNTLNKKSELVSKCRHKNKFLIRSCIT